MLTQNPTDYRGWFFRAGTLARLGRMDDAVEHYGWGLTVRPRYDGILQVLGRNEKALHLKVADQPFHLRAAVRKTDDGASVFYDDARPYWLAYGLVRAALLGSPEVRRRLGTDDGRSPTAAWSSKEEQYALIGLISGYRHHRSTEKIPADPQLERLSTILDSGMLLEFVLYEVASRMHPHLVATLDDEMQRHVHTFVKRFVMGVPAAPHPG